MYYYNTICFDKRNSSHHLLPWSDDAGLLHESFTRALSRVKTLSASTCPADRTRGQYSSVSNWAIPTILPCDRAVFKHDQARFAAQPGREIKANFRPREGQSLARGQTVARPPANEEFHGSVAGKW
eukprot:scaffold3069_cov215-Amphora_coffeaeformis.AAC.21